MSLAKLLLFSADSVLTNSVTMSLIQAGYKVISSSLGTGALEMIQAEKPALVILDLALPDYNSFSIIRNLRSDISARYIPVILMGSNMREGDALIGLEIGADLCLLEAFHPQVFAARVRSLLRRSDLIKPHRIKTISI